MMKNTQSYLEAIALSKRENAAQQGFKASFTNCGHLLPGIIGFYHYQDGPDRGW
jgi:hypothetical protein